MDRNMRDILCVEIISLILSSANPALAIQGPVTRCTIEPHLPCTLHFFKGNAECFRNTLKSGFPRLYTSNNGTTPGNLHNLTYHVYPRLDPMTVARHPYINFMIIANNESTLKYVSGFELNLINEKNEWSCVVIDMSNVTWKAADKDSLVQILVTSIPLESGLQHSAVLVSLPSPDRHDQLTVEIPPQVYSDLDAASKWTTDLTVHVLEKQRQVDVSFDQAPTQFNFTEYEITLYNKSGGEMKRAIVEKTTYNFTEIVPGEYILWIRAYDPNYVSGLGNCLCYNRDSCVPCSPSRYSKNISITDGGEAMADSSSSTWTLSDVTTIRISAIPNEDTENYSRQMIAFLIVMTCGALLAIVTVCLGIVHVWRRNKVEATSFNDDSPNMNSDTLPQWSCDSESDVITIVQLSRQKQENDTRIVPSKKKVLLTYEEEDKMASRHVTDAFAIYLQSHCFCDVMVVPWKLDVSWVTKALGEASVLVVMDTDVAYDRYNSLKCQSVDSGPEDNSILSKLIRNDLYQRNALTVRLSRGTNSDQGRSLQNFGFVNNFDLLEEHAAFLKRLHGMPVEADLDRTRLSKIIQDNEEGRNLKASIRFLIESSGLPSKQDCGVISDYDIRGSTTMDTPVSGCVVAMGNAPPKSVDNNLVDYLDAWSQGVVTIFEHDCKSSNPMPKEHNSIWDTHDDHPTIFEKQTTFDHISYIPPEDLDDVSQSLSNQMSSINNNYMRHTNKSSCV